MGKPSAPDPGQTAAAQAGANKETAIATGEINRVNQYGPFGSSTYTVTGYNPDGTPIYAQNTNLSAPVQNILNTQLQNQQAAQGISGNLLQSAANEYSHPIDTSNVNALTNSAGPASASGIGNYATTAGNGGGDIQRSLGDWSNVPGVIQGAQDAAYQNQMAYLNPQFANQQSDLNAQLAAQGITQGSDAWNRAQGELSRNQTFGQQQAQNAAFNQGINAGNTAFGMNLQAGNFANQAQQQGYSEAANNAALQNQQADAQTRVNMNNAQMANQMAMFNANLNNQAHAQGMQDAFAKYNQPLQTYNALQSGAQPTMPSFGNVPGVNVAPTDVAGIVNQGYGNQVGAYNGTMQGIGTLGAAALMMMSDERLKENIEREGTTPGGNKIYSYNFKGDSPKNRQVGVLAQQLMKKQPEAVHEMPSGFLAVDYAKVK
jgi:hypothetical protein